MKKLLPYVLAFHAALAAAILLWALQEKFPGPLTNTLGGERVGQRAGDLFL